METKSKIMNSAFELLAQKGGSFSLTEVASAVGIKKASIYSHFENKDMLVYEVVDREIKKYFFEINQEQDDLRKIFFGVLEYYDSSHLKLLFWKRLLLLPPESIDSHLIDKIQLMSNERYNIVKNLIKRDIKLNILKNHSDEEICLMFFALINGLLSNVLIYHLQDIKKYYNSIWNTFWNSIIT